MVRSLNLILLSFAGLAVSQDLSLAVVKRAFEAASIPSDLFINFNPRALLEVTFPEPTARPITLHAGEHLRPCALTATAGPPRFGVIGDVGKGPFVIATVDPDAPTPQDPSEAQIRHFLGPNFFAEALPVNHVQVLVNRTAPAAFNDQTLVNSTTAIDLFNISSFAAATGLGDPIAGTFMLVAPDPTET